MVLGELLVRSEKAMGLPLGSPGMRLRGKPGAMSEVPEADRAAPGVLVDSTRGAGTWRPASAAGQLSKLL